MKLKKTINFFLTLSAIVGASFFFAGCGEKSDSEKAEDTIEDAGKNATDAIKGIGK